jgi:hypothetical protein
MIEYNNAKVPENEDEARAMIAVGRTWLRTQPDRAARAFTDAAYYQEQCSKLQEEADANKEDAERYRWWVKNACENPSAVGRLLASAVYPEDITERIDAARSAADAGSAEK